MPTRLSYLTHDETLYVRPATFAESWTINGKETKPSTHVGFVEFNDMKKFDEEYAKIQALKSTDQKKEKTRAA
jgi:hypothetical protein